MAEKLEAREAVNALDWDAVYKAARKRCLNDATMSPYDDHLAREVAERVAAYLTATPDRSDDALAEENRGRPFSEWHEDHGQVLWWKLPISEAPYCGSPLDLGRTMEVTVQIGREEHFLSFVNTGGWPFDESDEPDLWWTPLPKPTFARAALKGDGL